MDDDKLAGDITMERYAVKHKIILPTTDPGSKDDLAIEHSTSAQLHEKAINLIKITQIAKDEYLSQIFRVKRNAQF